MALAPQDVRLQPFALGEGEASVVLIHGFTGTPYEMRYLGESLSVRGFRAVGVRLPGHGVDPDVLARTCASDWINEARAALLAQPADRPAFLVGLSMGSLVAALLAADHPERVSGIALCAPALWLRPNAEAMITLAGFGIFNGLISSVRKERSLVEDPAARAELPHLPRIPARSAAQFDKVRALARAALPRVQAPALVIWSERDPTVPPAAAQACADRLGSRTVRRLRLERSRHILTVDVEREQVADEIGRFFDSLRGARG